jgi:hypothetical protein
VRDILANVLTFWFFATPIVYPWRRSRDDEAWLNLNPFAHSPISYQEILFIRKTLRPQVVAAALAARRSWSSLWATAVRSAARFAGGGRVSAFTSAQARRHRARPLFQGLSPVHARHFATLKSAVLQRSLVTDLKPDEIFPALTIFRCRCGPAARPR